MKTILSHSREETKKIASDWIDSLSKKEDGATVVGLYGNLGAGKTAFTQFVGREMGVEEALTSPTFVILKMYETKHSSFKRLIHIDAYRLQSGKELQNLNFEELVRNPNNLIIIEWPDNIRSILPEDHIKIHCQFVDQNTREFKF